MEYDDVLFVAVAFHADHTFNASVAVEALVMVQFGMM
jgi:hypothetical protein